MEDKLREAMAFPPVVPPRVTEQSLRERAARKRTKLQIQLLSLLSFVWTGLLACLAWVYLPVAPVCSLAVAAVLAVGVPVCGGLTALALHHERRKERKRI